MARGCDGSHVSPAPDYRRDPRLKSLRSFFDKANCPAWKYSAVFLEAADTYDLDWRLLPSISYVESTGGKSAPRRGSAHAAAAQVAPDRRKNRRVNSPCRARNCFDSLTVRLRDYGPS